MNFVINAKEFARALKPAVNVSTKNTTKEFDYINRMALNVQKDQIIVSAFGGTACLVSNISDKYFSALNYSCKEEGEVVVDASIMTEALSVFSSSDIEVSLSSGQLVLSLLSDKDIIQPVPVFSDKMNLPNLAVKFNREIEVYKEIFVEGLNKVSFAMAIEETKRNYMCLIFESSNKKLRFAAGSGARFAVSDVEGENIGSKESAQIIFPKNNISNIISILSEVSGKVIIKIAEANEKENIPAQIILEADGIVLGLFSIDSSIKYPDLDSILSFDYPNKIYTNIEDWKPTIAGISATMHVDSDTIHNTEIVSDVDNKCFKVETKSLLKAKNKVKFTNDEKCKVKGENPWFRCNSYYLKEMVSKSNKSENIMINFEDQGELDSDNTKRIKPVLVKFDDYKNEARNTIEKYSMFFSISTK